MNLGTKHSQHHIQFDQYYPHLALGACRAEVRLVPNAVRHHPRKAFNVKGKYSAIAVYFPYPLLITCPEWTVSFEASFVSNKHDDDQGVFDRLMC